MPQVSKLLADLTSNSRLRMHQVAKLQAVSGSDIKTRLALGHDGLASLRLLGRISAA